MHLSKLKYLIRKIQPPSLPESSIHPLKIKKEEGEKEIYSIVQIYSSSVFPLALKTTFQAKRST